MSEAFWEHLLDRVFSSLGAEIATVIVLLGAFVATVYFVSNAFREGGNLTGHLMRAFASAVREIRGGPGVTSPERINGLLLTAFFLIFIALLVLLVFHTVHDVFFSHTPELTLVVLAITSLVIFALVGLKCVQICSHHSLEVDQARQGRSRQKA
jgi:cytosine/uracil/thiamine/allantoin permease